jgi:hypothetical protein
MISSRSASSALSSSSRVSEAEFDFLAFRLLCEMGVAVAAVSLANAAKDEAMSRAPFNMRSAVP